MTNILICGVGGQGIVLTSKLIAATAMEKGSPVRSAETIGMAQKGGSVTSYLRIGECSAPMFCRGEADIMIAFEPAEAVREFACLRKGGTVVL
ncbi:MAG: 2-oxoacid:acceptor oxidoreductase family protein, partial [Oscillospiraceae bacterium]|nr:2-oxoacid:acceptor oxidoreductase family protein [Oscillospiraceae bacterium]